MGQNPEILEIVLKRYYLGFRIQPDSRTGNCIPRRIGAITAAVQRRLCAAHSENKRREGGAAFIISRQNDDSISETSTMIDEESGVLALLLFLQPAPAAGG